MAKYSDAIEWIALNDSPADSSNLEFDDAVDNIKFNVTVCLIADVWNKENLEVAKEVITFRKKHLGL